MAINRENIWIKREYDTESGKDIYMFNDGLISKNELFAFFGLSAIDLNKYTVSIHQGKINEIANMNESDIMELLFNYSGVKEIRQRLESATSKLTECTENTDRMSKNKVSLETKLNYYLSQIKDFKELEKLYQERHACEYLKLKKEGETFADQVHAIEKNKKKLLEELSNDMTALSKFEDEHLSVKTKIREIRSSLVANRDKKLLYQKYFDKHEKQEESFENFDKQYHHGLEGKVNNLTNF